MTYCEQCLKTLTLSLQNGIPPHFCSNECKQSYLEGLKEYQDLKKKAQEAGIHMPGKRFNKHLLKNMGEKE